MPGADSVSKRGRKTGLFDHPVYPGPGNHSFAVWLRRDYDDGFVLVKLQDGSGSSSETCETWTWWELWYEGTKLSDHSNRLGAGWALRKARRGKSLSREVHA